MRRLTDLASSAMATVLFVAAVLPAQAQEGGPGKPAPVPGAKSSVDADFVGKDGKTVRLSDFRGKKAVVLLFMRGFTGEFACFYCGEQTKDYVATCTKFAEAGAEVLEVLPGTRDVTGYLEKVGRDDPEATPKILLPFAVVGDPDFSACRAFDVPFDISTPGAFPVSRPATVVVGKDGLVLYAYHGKDPSDRPTSATVLGVLRGEKPEAPAPDSQKVEATPSLPWTAYAKGMEEAKASRRPVFLEFHADW